MTKLQAERDALTAIGLGTLSHPQKKRPNAILDEREAILDRRERRRVVAASSSHPGMEKGGRGRGGGGDEEVTEEAVLAQLLFMMSLQFSPHCGGFESPYLWQFLVRCPGVARSVHDLVTSGRLLPGPFPYSFFLRSPVDAVHASVDGLVVLHPFST